MIEDSDNSRNFSFRNKQSFSYNNLFGNLKDKINFNSNHNNNLSNYEKGSLSSNSGRTIKSKIYQQDGYNFFSKYMKDKKMEIERLKYIIENLK